MTTIGANKSGPSVIRSIIWNISRNLTFFALGLYTTYGIFAAYSMSAINEALAFPSDAESLSLFKPYDEESTEIEEYIRDHPIAQSYRANPGFIESRPHMRFPERWRQTSLTAGTLLGHKKVAVPPLVFCERGGKSLISISYLGSDLCGHPGIIHGGLLATMLDEGMARCCFPALPNKIGLTANLNVNYRAPAPSGTYVILRATTTKVEGRKAWVDARIETLPRNGERSLLLAEGSGLFIEPKQAGVLAMGYPISEE